METSVRKQGLPASSFRVNTNINRKKFLPHVECCKETRLLSVMSQMWKMSTQFPQWCLKLFYENGILSASLQVKFRPEQTDQVTFVSLDPIWNMAACFQHTYLLTCWVLHSTKTQNINRIHVAAVKRIKLWHQGRGTFGVFPLQELRSKLSSGDVILPPRRQSKWTILTLD